MMDAEDRALFDRSLRAATAEHTGPALDAALNGLGWADALADDPEAAVGLLFEHQGAANATSSSLDRVIATVLGAPDAAVLLPAMGRHVGTAALSAATTVVLGDRSTVDATSLDVRPVVGLDPTLGLVEVAGDLSPLPDEALAAGQRAVAHELVGASRTMLALARDHAVDRIQFGVPIASFQAVRHRLAESLVAIEAADAALGAAWLDPTPLAAALAKAIAGRSTRAVARHAQQVLAGVGFTTEHDLHRYVRRTIVLDHLLGDHKTLTAELGAQLRATRQVPSLLPL
jgi:hypothetical protein